jgi:hypothetical protein
MKLKILAAFTALVASGSSLASSIGAGEIDGVIKYLDLTTFPNSVGPRRMPGKTTFADYGFIHVENTASGAKLVRDDKGWTMGFSIISAGPTSLRLCFYDRGLAQPGDVFVPSYNATSALLVSKSRRGMWAAEQVPAGFANCQNDPAAA